MSSDTHVMEGNYECDHPGCPAEIKIVRVGKQPVPDKWFVKCAVALGWLILRKGPGARLYAEPRTRRTMYCPDCKSRYQAATAIK